jgi:membrane-associated phospholipid phosphatase
MTRCLRRSLGLASAALLSSVGSLLVAAPPAAAATGTATTDSVYYWNTVLLEAFRRETPRPGPLTRAAAMMHAGIHDVLASSDQSRQGEFAGRYNGYAYSNPDGDPVVDDDLAVGYAARDLLIDALPAQRSYVEQKFSERHGSASQAAAVSAATEVVDAMRTRRADDGADATPAYTYDNVAGAWRPTGNCTAVTPHWGKVRPFVSETAQMRPPLPGGSTTYADLLAGDLYAANVNEVKSLGRADSTTRTAEQTQIAWFWANDLNGTYTPPGQLLALTEIIAKKKYPRSPMQTARLFALASLAMADAAIAAWDRKYDTAIDLWRPETAIALADTDNNPATNADTTWQPLSADRSGIHFSPCWPAWISGHATLSGAWAGVMRTEFGDSVTFTATTDDPHAAGVTRRFSSFTAAAADNARSRVYLGVHYQFDADDGLATGLTIGDYVGRTQLRFDSRDCRRSCFGRG